MMITSPAFAEAYAAHAAGRLDDAEQGYRSVLTGEPEHADALHLLGVVAQQKGRLAEASELIRRALKLSGPNAGYLANLGITLQGMGRLDEAAAALEEAALLDPASFNTLFALGNALRSLNRLPEAEARFRDALALQPSSAPAHNNLGNTLQDLRRLPDAEAEYRHATHLDPKHARAHYNLGIVLKDTGRLVDAAASLQQALEISSDFVEAHLNLGVVMHDLGQLDTAAFHARRASALDPRNASALNNLGAVLRDAGDFEGAMKCYEAALALEPTLAAARHNEGVALERQGRGGEALERYQQAQKLDGAFAEAEQNAALLMLSRGEFQAGWQAYEARWRRNAADRIRRDFPYPFWQGENDRGAVLVWGEQGIGDEILYASMIPDLLAQKRGVVLETDRRLVPLFERSFPGVQIAARTEPPLPVTRRSDTHWQVPIAGLGRWLRTSAESFPKRASYLVADEARRARYRTQLESNHGGAIVGISWISRNPKVGNHKSLDLKQWAPLLGIPGIRFVDLQYGDTSSERAAVEKDMGVAITHIDGLDLFADIDGAAALAAACDLVISISSTTVHLAAALGKQTWVLVPAATGNLWYWMAEGDHTPWYPSVRVFRQGKPGEWSEVIKCVAETLRTTLSGLSRYSKLTKE